MAEHVRKSRVVRMTVVMLMMMVPRMMGNQRMKTNSQ